MLQMIFEGLAKLGQTARKRMEDGYLFHENDPVRYIYFVERGCVELKRAQDNGNLITLQRATEGSFLAEASLYASQYHCDAFVAVPAELVQFSKADVIRAFRTDPRLSDLWATHLAKEVQRARGQIEILSRNTVSERLDGWLAWSGEQLPKKGEWKQVAAQIAVSPEALYRELSRRRKG